MARRPDTQLPPGNSGRPDDPAARVGARHAANSWGSLRFSPRTPTMACPTRIVDPRRPHRPARRGARRGPVLAVAGERAAAGATHRGAGAHRVSAMFCARCVSHLLATLSREPAGIGEATGADDAGRPAAVDARRRPPPLGERGARQRLPVVRGARSSPRPRAARPASSASDAYGRRGARLASLRSRRVRALAEGRPRAPVAAHRRLRGGRAAFEGGELRAAALLTPITSIPATTGSTSCSPTPSRCSATSPAST